MDAWGQVGGMVIFLDNSMLKFIRIGVRACLVSFCFRN